MPDATPGTPVDPRNLLTAALEHAPHTILAGPLADLVVKEMRNGLWWLDKTETIRPAGDLPEIAFNAVYADKARAVLALPVVDEGSLSSQASGTPAGYVAFNGDLDHLYSQPEDVETFIREMAEPGDDWRIYEVRAASGTPTETGQVTP